ncbi:MAG TPA: hypothetical protein GXZ85_08710 [Firmicutes bacterium]|jgi:hypothetical protein|nr:hypothetical protein [Bacillota bacterium]
MNQAVLIGRIRDRINVLKSEQIGLKLFIQSDQNRHEALEKAISELNWVLETIEHEED